MRGTLKRHRYGRRSGTILVLAAFLLIVLLSMSAVAVDIGVIAAARAQLKTVTDAAALAGVKELASDRRISTSITDLTPETTAAVAKAVAVGNLNTVLGQSPQLVASNVVVGYKDPSSTSPDSAVSTGGSATQYNSVQVTATVTVPALFSAAFRAAASTVSVTSTATAEVFPIKGFRDGLSLNAAILPLVIDLAAYNRMTLGAGGDSYRFTPASYNPPATGVTSGADGIAESVTYPVTTGASGNFGTINFGVANNSTKILGDQISFGVTPTQMKAEFSGTDVSAPHSFGGNTGVSAGIKDNLAAIIGKSVTVPVYDTTTGNGSNATYHVIKYASVRIVAVDLTGNPKYVVMQPALNTDPTAIPDTTTPSTWSSGGAVVLHLSR